MLFELQEIWEKFFLSIKVIFFQLHGHVGLHQMLNKIPDVEPKIVFFLDNFDFLFWIVNVGIEMKGKTYNCTYSSVI